MRDLVYIVRPGENEELRYSLRSAVNLSHRKVWIVGSCPGWVRKARRLKLSPLEDKWANIRQSLEAVCADDRVADEIVVMCDDFFILEPISSVPMFHLGRLSDYIRTRRLLHRGNSWFDGVRWMHKQMVDWGYPNALCYEGHMPMPFNRHKLRSLLERSMGTFLWGCVYTATGRPAGVQGANVKVAACDPLTFARRLDLLQANGQPFLSTDERSFAIGAVGEYIRGLFPDPGPYEEAP